MLKLKSWMIFFKKIGRHEGIQLSLKQKKSDGAQDVG